MFPEFEAFALPGTYNGVDLGVGDGEGDNNGLGFWGSL
jgi:hypothetical protein